MFAGFSETSDTVRSKIISLIKQLAVKFHLIPKTMKGKEKLKRLFFGKLQPLPPEISEELAPYTPPVPISLDTVNKNYKVLYAVGYV